MYLSPAYEINCPSCGRFLRGKVRQAALLICNSCNSVILDPHGTPLIDNAVAPLAPAHSLIRVGTQGKLNRAEFEITGRIHYEYNDGFINDWHLVTEDRKAYWLSESFGHYAIFSAKPEDDIEITDTNFQPDENTLTVQNQTLVYEGSDSCTGFSFEGELSVNPNTFKIPFLCLSYSNNQILACAHVFSSTENNVYLGMRTTLEQLSLTHLSR